MPAIVPLVRNRFGVGAADFNADGTHEIVILSLSCDDSGCPVAVKQNAGGQTSLIFAQTMSGGLALTNERVSGLSRDRGR